MAYREFVDGSGQSWRVWSTVPSTGSRLRGGFGQGWLTFERINADNTLPLRRLVPIPADWESAAEGQLELLCREAEEVARPRAGQSRPESSEAAHQE